LEKILFIAEDIHLKSEISGGVQICTDEYIELLKTIGFEVIVYPVKHTRNIYTRIKIKLGVELYTRYDFKKESEKIVPILLSEKINYVAINQIDFIKITPFLKLATNNKVQIWGLSHGNESGDFLHHIVRGGSNNFFKRLRDISRLGFAVYNESYFFTNFLDAVFSISETEKEINNWLGAKKSVFIPRILQKRFLDWKPVLGRVGFVGTLNHKPNFDGLKMLLEALNHKRQENIEVQIIGSPAELGKQLENEYNFVKYLGRLTDEAVENAAKNWAMVLNPVFWYSRGASTKLAQAIGWGIPIATTKAGNRGYVWKKGLLPEFSLPKEVADFIFENSLSEEKLQILANEVKTIATNSPTLTEIAENVKLQLNLKW